MTLASDSDATPGFFCEQTEDQADLCGPGMRIAFARAGAVWTHAIFTSAADGTEIEIARTVESDPERDQPTRVVSPVYQDIQRHHGAEGPGLCLLATGTLYQHHFSAVITLGYQPGRPGDLVLDVDVADRCRRAVESLAATYTVRLDSGALVAAGPEAIVWDLKGGSLAPARLELEAVAPSTLVMAEAGRAATRVQILAAVEPGGFTHRLHYRWRWANRS